MAKSTLSSSMTSDETFEDFGEGTSTFGIHGDRNSSFVSLGTEQSACKLTSRKSSPMPLVQMSSSGDDDNGEDGQGLCAILKGSSSKLLVASAAVFQCLLILVALTVVKKYGVFSGPPSLESEPEGSHYYDRVDIQQPDPNLAEDYSGVPNALEPDPHSAPTKTPVNPVNPIIGADNGSRPLLCLFADTYEGDFPTQLCSHLVFMDAVLDLQTQIVRPRSSEQGRAVLQRFIGQRRDQELPNQSRFLVSLWEARVADTYQDLFRDWSRATRAASLAFSWLQRTGLDGLALLNLAATAGTVNDFLGIFKTQRLSWSTGPVELYQRQQGRLCISLTLATFRFIVHVSPGHIGARCYNYYPASVRQHCQEKRKLSYDQAAIANYAQVPPAGEIQSPRLEAFDTVATLRKKLALILDEYPSICVALYNADLEDYRGVCDVGEPFARITAVRQVLDSKAPALY